MPRFLLAHEFSFFFLLRCFMCGFSKFTGFQISEKIVCDMFNLNASDFTSMLATFPNDLKNRLQAIVRKNSFTLSTGGMRSLFRYI